MNASNANTELMPKEVYLCAICNISSGSCSEDCKFCTQSAKYHVDIEIYKQKDLQLILEEANLAIKNQALGFCLVSSGRGLDERTLKFVCEASNLIKKHHPDLNMIACNGIATKEQLRILKDSGIRSYNHNLESSQNYYEKICSTHSWSERFETCEAVQEVGLDLCCGGIWGMGESNDDRESLLDSIVSLDPVSVAMNFYHPNSALPLEKNIDIDEALLWIRKTREALPKSMVMVAGGREITFKERVADIFKSGANSIVIGNYLTTSGDEPNRDLLMLEELGLKVAKSCG
ncbi:MAG: biotin synthase [Sulfurospirillum sp.]|nr:MAG: biotin synthase [Sulfurospirillum sp.]